MSRVAAVLAALVLVTGCSGGNQPDVTAVIESPTAQAIVGEWDQKDGPLVVWFRPDGTFALDDHGDLADPVAEGTYEVEQGRIHFASDRNEVCEGDQWTWEGAVSNDGELALIITRTRGGCGPSKVSFSTFERVG